MKQLVLAISVLLLSACSAQLTNVKVRGETPSNVAVKSIDKTMYVRGDFTLWDADAAYQLRAVSPGLYQVRVKLTTPGKVYEFKIADAAWTEGYNCGYAVDGRLMLGEPKVADCHTVYNYFNFTPDRKGTYLIELDYRNPRQPLVSVQQG
ncbi:putative orphan protein [Pseudoalteromonas luteoviolacea B = ATCC 29581]|nr:putative orphan protein [Pseudoalteromonas luteoviolacea B = ATCC 29581]